jgi:hypothetical protein
MKAAAAIVLVLATARVWADPPGLTPTAATTTAAPVEDNSYRLQIGIANAAGIAMIVATAGSDRALELSIATFIFASPAVHLFHDRPTRALASLGLHVGVPLLGILVGVGVGGGNRPADEDDLGPAIIGGLIGAAAGAAIASIIDISVLAKNDAPSRVLPVIAPTPGGAGGMTFGLAGAF